MSDIQRRGKQKILELLSYIHQSLSEHPCVQGEARDLEPAQEQLMRELKDYPFLYQNWVTLLAVDSYSSTIIESSKLFEQLSGMLTSLLEKIKEMGQVLKSDGDRRQIISCYHNSYQTLLETIKISQQMFPNSIFTEDQNLLIDNSSHKVNAQDILLNRLREQNAELNKKLRMNDEQILKMEFKLTKLLKEHQDCQRTSGYQLNSTMALVELREEVAFKEQEIERMNEEFSYQIQKYNTVYDAMKKELEEMKGYQNIDLIQQIEVLQTEIVRMREERERDQIIMGQLRSDNMALSGASYGSPRASKRYVGSRYNY